MSPGTDSTGLTVSTTVTVKLRVPALPALSVAEQVTVVVPTANVEPLAGVHTGVNAPSTLSTADAVKLYTAPAGEVACSVAPAGTVMTGGVVSTTVMVKFISATLPCESVAVQEIVVVPYPKSVVEDDTGTGWPSLVQETVTLMPSSASTASLALAEYGTTAPAGLVPCTTLAGASGLKAIVGAAVSKMSKRSPVGCSHFGRSGLASSGLVVQSGACFVRITEVLAEGV